MKNIYKLIIVCFISLFSCNQDELLDKDPYDKITTENLITDFTSLEATVNGVYNIFQDGYYYSSSFVMISDLMSDNTQATWSAFRDIDTYQVTADNTDVSRLWNKITSLIAQSSIVINQAENFNFGIDNAAATTLIGQLYVARALAYFDLQRFFAQPYNFSSDASHLGVPIINEDLVGIEIINSPRSTTASVYSKIISDLETGISKIGDDTSSVFYLNKNSAKALLARVYLYMENWSEANSLASEIIDSGNYTLVSNSDYVGSWSLDSSTESIFSIANMATDNSNFTSIPYYYGRPRFNATSHIYAAIETGDVRKNLIVSGKVLKYPAYATKDNNIPIVRLSEMYLIKAEALAEMGGSANETNARAAINTLLLRANPLAAPITDTGSALKNRIEDERRKELMFEGHRIFDLTRKKKSFTKYSTAAGLPIVVNYPSNYSILPIPQSEIDANASISITEQNPGY